MTNRALVIGVNTCLLPANNLLSALNDANAWTTLFTNKGYVVTTLTGNLCTRANILAHLNRLVALTSNKTDNLVITYSGHGTQMLDTNRDEADKLDEGLNTYDLTANMGNILKDEDIKRELDRLRTGCTVDVFVDACHSGTVTDMNAKYNHVLWTACRSDQVAHCSTFDGVARGCFSMCLTTYLEAHPTYTRLQMLDYIKATIASWGPIWTQVPQLECSAVEAGQVPFT